MKVEEEEKKKSRLDEKSDTVGKKCLFYAKNCQTFKWTGNSFWAKILTIYLDNEAFFSFYGHE